MQDPDQILWWCSHPDPLHHRLLGGGAFDNISILSLIQVPVWLQIPLSGRRKSDQGEEQHERINVTAKVTFLKIVLAIVILNLRVLNSHV